MERRAGKAPVLVLALTSALLIGGLASAVPPSSAPTTLYAPFSASVSSPTVVTSAVGCARASPAPFVGGFNTTTGALAAHVSANSKGCNANPSRSNIANAFVTESVAFPISGAGGLTDVRLKVRENINQNWSVSRGSCVVAGNTTSWSCARLATTTVTMSLHLLDATTRNSSASKTTYSEVIGTIGFTNITTVVNGSATYTQSHPVFFSGSYTSVPTAVIAVNTVLNASHVYWAVLEVSASATTNLSGSNASLAGVSASASLELSMAVLWVAVG